MPRSLKLANFTGKIRMNPNGTVTLIGNRLKVTDRAYRYRANAEPPAGPKRCAFCGTTKKIMVGHLNGHEEDNSPDNKIWTCRSCNGKTSHRLKRARIGRRTRQYNPASEGAKSWQQWAAAVMSMKGEANVMPVSEAVELIRATPQKRRSKFASEIYDRRRQIYGSTGRSDSVPF